MQHPMTEDGALLVASSPGAFPAAALLPGAAAGASTARQTSPPAPPAAAEASGPGSTAVPPPAAHFGALAAEHGAALLSLATGLAGGGIGLPGGPAVFPPERSPAHPPAFGAHVAPPLLSQLPHHLQSWLQVHPPLLSPAMLPCGPVSGSMLNPAQADECGAPPQTVCRDLLFHACKWLTVKCTASCC